MKVVKRLSLILCVLVVMVCGALPALAQGDDDPLCNGLSSADCKILTDATGKMGEAASFRVPAWSFSFEANLEGEQVSMKGLGSAHMVLPSDPTQPLEDMLLHLVIENMTVVSPDGTERIGLQVLITEGMMYLQIDNQWYGGELSSGDFGDLTEILPGGGLFGGEVPTPDEIASALQTAVAGATTTTRGEDDEMMGQPVATFTTTIDITQLIIGALSIPEVTSLLGESMGEDLDMSTLKPEDLQMLGSMLGPFFKDSSITFGQWVGLEDGDIHAISLDVMILLDPLLLGFLAPEGKLPSVQSEPLKIEFHFKADVDDINETFEIAPPAEYLPLEGVEGGKLEL